MKFRCAIVKPKDRLAIWVEHLILNHLLVEGYPSESVLIGQDGIWRYRPVKEAGMYLQKLLDLYGRGLCLPLRFFPNASWAYADARCKGKSSQEGLRVAERKWLGNDFGIGNGEREEPYHWLGFRHIMPLDEEFQTLSMEVFGPLIEYERKESE